MPGRRDSFAKDDLSQYARVGQLIHNHAVVCLRPTYLEISICVNLNLVARLHKKLFKQIDFTTCGWRKSFCYRPSRDTVGPKLRDEEFHSFRQAEQTRQELFLVHSSRRTSKGRYSFSDVLPSRGRVDSQREDDFKEDSIRQLTNNNAAAGSKVLPDNSSRQLQVASETAGGRTRINLIQNLGRLRFYKILDTQFGTKKGRSIGQNLPEDIDKDHNILSILLRNRVI